MTQPTRLEQPWVIRKTSGQMYSCPDVLTLKRWIAEGRLRPQDQISKKGERWFTLGESPDLSRYFRQFTPVPRTRSQEHAITRKRRMHDDTLDKMVNRFTTKRRMRTAVLAIAGASLVAIALGFSFAMLGGSKNPVRRFMEERGVLPGKELAEKAYVQRTEIAQTAWARGDVADYERAEEMLTKAKNLRENDTVISADLALVYASHADALKRLAAEDIEDAAALEDGEQKDRLQLNAAQRQRRAVELITLAKTELKNAEAVAPRVIATLRANVEVARVSGDRDRERQAIEQLELALQNDAGEDPWSYEILARAAVPDPAQADSASIETALLRLDKAIALQPKLDRARVQRARILAARGSLQDAEQELAVVLGEMPSYEEAQRVLGRVKKEIAAETANSVEQIEG